MSVFDFIYFLLFIYILYTVKESILYNIDSYFVISIMHKLLFTIKTVVNNKLVCYKHRLLMFIACFKNQLKTVVKCLLIDKCF